MDGSVRSLMVVACTPSFSGVIAYRQRWITSFDPLCCPNLQLSLNPSTIVNNKIVIFIFCITSNEHASINQSHTFSETGLQQQFLKIIHFFFFFLLGMKAA